MKANIQLKLIQKLSSILIKLGLDSIISTNSSSVYRIANFLVNQSVSPDEILEIEGFKIKKGRTTRYVILTGTLGEPDIVNLIKNKVNEGMIVLDVGANIGIITLLLSKQVGTFGHVFSFEPDPSLYNILKENIELNNLKNVSIFPLAISDKAGISKLSLNQTQDGDNRLDSVTMRQDCIEVETTTLDEFCTKHDILPDFIKMDIQGSEPKALEGMKKVVLKNPNIKLLTEFYPSAIIDVDNSPKNFLEDLEKMGFSINRIPKKKESEYSIKGELLKMKKNEYVNLFCSIKPRND